MLLSDRDFDKPPRQQQHQQHQQPTQPPPPLPPPPQRTGSGPMPPTPPADDKPYHAKRPHRKSRMGCRNCKTRKVKCDEKKPSCRNCTLRKETCNYPPQSPASSSSTHSSSSHSAAAPPASRSTAGLASASSAAAAAAAAASASSSPPSAASASASASASAIGSAASARLPITTPTVTHSALSTASLLLPSPVTPSASSASPLSCRTAVSPTTSVSASTCLSLAQRSPPMAPQRGCRRESHDGSSASDTSTELIIVHEPPFKFGGADECDMKLLWFYTTETFSSFSVEPGKLPFIDCILKSTIPKFAFQSPFLMDCILGLSALHMQSMNLAVPMSKAITYRARAFAGYRQAIEKADPNDFPALLVCSLLLTALSSELFRVTDVKPLYIIDWMIVWRGIRLIFDIIPVETLYGAGLEKLFSRGPAFDLNEAALHIPGNLLFMISTIKEGDQDYPFIETYYDTLRFLGGVYAELEAGLSPTLTLRIITWFTFLPTPFVELARLRRPRALVIVAHYLAFFKMVPNVWWIVGIGDRGIQDIIAALGPEWQTLLNVPRAAVHTSDRVDLAKLIKGNHAWEPPTEKDSIAPTMLMVNDVGEEVAYDKQRGWVPLFHSAAPESSSSGSSSTPSPRYSGNPSPPQT